MRQKQGITDNIYIQQINRALDILQLIHIENQAKKSIFHIYKESYKGTAEMIFSDKTR